MSFIAGAALFCDCGGGKIAALFCDCGEGARGSGAPRAAERASSLAARLAAPPRRSPRRLSRRLSSRVAPRPAGRRPRRSAPWRRPRGRRATETPGEARSPRVPPAAAPPSPGSRLTARARAAARAGRGRLLFLSPSPFPNGGGVFTVFTRGCIAGGSLRAPRAASAAAAADCASDGGSLRLLAGGTLRTSRAGRSVTFGIVVRSFVSLRASSTTHGSVGSSTSSSGSATAASVLARHSRSAVECLQLRGGCARGGATARAQKRVSCASPLNACVLAAGHVHETSTRDAASCVSS